MDAPVSYANGERYPPAPSGKPDLPSPCNAYTKLPPAGAGYLVETGNPR